MSRHKLLIHVWPLVLLNSCGTYKHIKGHIFERSSLGHLLLHYFTVIETYFQRLMIRNITEQ